jgi:hypothetical protein
MTTIAANNTATPDEYRSVHVLREEEASPALRVGTLAVIVLSRDPRRLLRDAWTEAPLVADEGESLRGWRQLDGPSARIGRVVIPTTSATRNSDGTLSLVGG